LLSTVCYTSTAHLMWPNTYLAALAIAIHMHALRPFHNF